MELEVLLAGVGRQLQGHLHDPHGSHATYGVVDHVGENVEAPFPSMLYAIAIFDVEFEVEFAVPVNFAGCAQLEMT